MKTMKKRKVFSILAAALCSAVFLFSPQIATAQFDEVVWVTIGDRVTLVDSVNKTADIVIGKSERVFGFTGSFTACPIRVLAGQIRRILNNPSGSPTGTFNLTGTSLKIGFIKPGNRIKPGTKFVNFQFLAGGSVPSAGCFLKRDGVDLVPVRAVR